MTLTPADRIARILRIDTKSATAFYLQVEKECKEFDVSADLIVTYLERNPQLPADPFVISQGLIALAYREIYRVANVLHCKSADAKAFCNAVQKAFPDTKIPLKRIAECVEKLVDPSLAPRMVVRELGGTRDVADLDLRPAPKARRKHHGGSGFKLPRRNSSIEAIKRRNGDWETD